MIKLHLDKKSLSKLQNDVQQQVNAIKEVNSSYSKQKIAEAAFTILATQFLKDISLAAKTDRKRFESLYEWTPQGVNIAKLFTIARGNVSNGKMTIILAPLNKPNQQSIPQQNPSTIVSRQAPFGQVVTINPRINIGNNPNNVLQNPATSTDNPDLVLLAFSEAWFEGKSQGIFDRSGIAENLSREINRALSEANPLQAVKQRISSVTQMYSQNRSVF